MVIIQVMISAEILEKFGDVMIGCPMPGQEHQKPQRLDEFAQTDRGQKYLGERFSHFVTLEEAGIGVEQAFTITLGDALVRDDAGEVVRDVSPPGAKLAEAQKPVLARSEKK